MSNDITLSRFVRVEAIGHLAEAVDKLNKRCVKLGAPTVTMREDGPRRWQQLCRVDPYGHSVEAYWEFVTGEPVGATVRREVANIVLSWPGNLAIPGGWRLVAIVERSGVDDDGGVALNEVRGFPGAGDLSAYRRVTLDCDHCRSNRRRNRVLVVEGADGARKQLGTGCIEEYLGIDVAAQVHAFTLLAEAFHDVFPSDDDDAVGGGGRGEWTENVDTIGVLSTYFGLECGFVSRKTANFSGKTATADQVFSLLVSRAPGAQEERAKVTAACEGERVKENWAKTRDELVALGERVRKDDGSLSDFEYSVAIAAARGYITRKGLGVLVAYCALAAARRAKAAAAPVEERLPSQHLGVVGERLSVDVEVLRLHTVDGAYGMRVIVAMRRVGSGDKLTWFASGWDGVERAGLAKGGMPAPGVHPVEALVDDHKVSKYGNDTVVKRLVRRLSPEELAKQEADKKAARKAARQARKAAAAEVQA